jgi:hypothetical protein
MFIERLFKPLNFSAGALTLTSIVLGFILLLVVIWLWYDIQLKVIESGIELLPENKATH